MFTARGLLRISTGRNDVEAGLLARWSCVVALASVLLAGCGSSTEEECARLGWERGTPQFDYCMRRGGIDDGGSGGGATSGPLKKQQRGF